MALKPRHKRRIFWSVVSLIAAVFVAVIIVPPMISLNHFKPVLERAIFEQTGVDAKLNGNIHFSLLGRATVVAHDVTIPSGKIDAIMLSIPFRDLFDIERANVATKVFVYGGDVVVPRLEPVMFNHNIEVNDTIVNFMGKKYKIIQADVSPDGHFNGIVRTKDHKYEVEVQDNEFYIHNKNNKLDMYGAILPGGVVSGRISVETDDINSWFGFKEPKINRPVKLTMNFEWNGDGEYSFTDINADNFNGDIRLFSNGARTITMSGKDVMFDFSFLLNPNRILHDTEFNLDFYGDLTFKDRIFKHLKISATGVNNVLKIKEIVADDIHVVGGEIDKNGARNIMVSMPYDGAVVTCLFNGTPQKWTCDKFQYGDVYGKLSVNDDVFDVVLKSEKTMPAQEFLIDMIAKLGKRGRVEFQFADIAGVFDVTPEFVKPTYSFAKQKTLGWVGLEISFLPDAMKKAVGDFSWHDGMLVFEPESGQWTLSVFNNRFYLAGKSFKQWLPRMDLQSINDSEYSVSGMFDGKNISGLVIKVNGHEFVGGANGKNINLKTDVLDIDSFVNKQFIDSYQELQFFTNTPILIPFDLDISLALSADALVYNKNKYKNFVYSLKPGVQTFSIDDNYRGNALVIIEKNKGNKYDISVQMNRFVIDGFLLPNDLPLNVSDTVVTAEMSFHTSGKIAHDITHNLTGNVEMSCAGGNFYGFGFDNMYSVAENISVLNAEQVVTSALDGGVSKIKDMYIVGDYKNGNFVTTKPIELSMRHVNVVGDLEYVDGQMSAVFDVVMRGTAYDVKPVSVGVMPDGSRKYSASQVMLDFDSSFFRSFVKTHNKF